MHFHSHFDQPVCIEMFFFEPPCVWDRYGSFLKQLTEFYIYNFITIPNKYLLIPESWFLLVVFVFEKLPNFTPINFKSRRLVLEIQNES